MSATYCPLGNTVSATLLPYGQYAPLLNRHLLPVGQYGVGYAIALWAIRSAFESPPIALWAIRCRLRYCPMGNTLRWRGYVLAAVAACAHTPRSFGLNRSPKSVCFLSDILRFLKPI